MLDALSIDVRVRVRMTWCNRRYSVGAVGDDAMAGLDVRAVELKADAVRRTDLKENISFYTWKLNEHSM